MITYIYMVSMESRQKKMKMKDQEG
ncbi:hypothetical protein B14911_26480 [Bacillus sp. NRRL B-14911]|nr:hypothetical protein B14911_26480 [Bacillus sp. NRRL B-14911]